MNILFLFLRHSEKKEDSTLTKDISDEFHKKGHNVIVATLLEKKENKKTQLKLENGYRVLRVRTGNYFDSVSKLEKGITALTMPFILKKEIINRFKNEKIDLIFTHTPFISNSYLINSLKKEFNCKSCLHLWDIFPQNAKDLKLLNNRLLLKYFRKKEIKMYEAFDYIGCMSKGNLEYINNKNNLKSKTFILKNWAKSMEKIIINKSKIREQYGYKDSDVILVFGGNMGKPQKLENILLLAERVKDIKNIKFLFIGKGTEKEKLETIKKEKNLENINFLNYVPREDYEKLTGACDIGVVSLDERFTVPNFPSKTTDYFKLNLPILASLDKCGAKDYGKFLQEEVKGGLYSLAGNTEELYKNLIKLYKDKDLRETLGNNGRKYYEENLGVDKAYETIMKEIHRIKGESNV
ncbi:Glycosyltransferase involved in cell wall bisynthesis [Cetobacterium ceti]|uniref:Glycosyltransferase involved in cell wall bisynthesis n=1 Tax=Cetobacterium ceti TaxID=180163 RepID=A0A1T4LSY2_9FUSO|nr:glycosyltransferase family 4 protein [Cetobacterium ceti]SJZ57638.1 Glycosyltransferase involved in cell wall bisynthesis [Cetobacterium ceti]